MYLNKNFLPSILINILGISIGYFLYKTNVFEQQQTITYIISRFLWINFLFFKNRFLKLLGIPWILVTWFLVVLWFFPLYNNGPDVLNFYLSQKTEYIFLGNPKNVEIKEIGQYGEQKIIPKENNQSLFLIESSWRTLSFEEKTNNIQEKNRLVIKFPNNTIYIVFPWSKIYLQKNGVNYIITKEYGKSEYYEPTNNTQVTITKNNFQEQKNKSEFSLSYMIYDYETLQTKYIIEQGGGFLIMQPIYQRLSKKIIDIAYLIRPEIYNKNLYNYEKYKQLLWRKDFSNQYKSVEKWWTPIVEQFKKWRLETRVLQ